MYDGHLIVVSVDALVYEDLEYAKTLPMFKKIIENGACIERITTIYPSLTHPVHASIITGCPAGETGIVSNEIFEAGKMGRPWYNYLNQINCETIFHAAKRAGLTTCACRWPVTAGGSDVIDYLVAEVFKKDVENYPEAPYIGYKNTGSGENVMDIVKKGLEIYTCTNDHPAYDEMEMYCGAEIIRRYKPNVFFCHPGYVDGERHRTGLFSDEVKESIKVTDKWLGMLWDAVCDAGIEDKTDFVIVSDHGHLSISRLVNPNVFLIDKGLITVDKENKLACWQVFIQSNALSGLVYLKNKSDKKLEADTYKMLLDMANEGIYGISQVFTASEAKEQFGLFGDFSFVIEGDGYSRFTESLSKPGATIINKDNVKYGSSSHGHLPNRGPQPTFLAMGPSFKKGAVVPVVNILNHAPTFAKILGVELKDAKGKAVCEILNI